MSRPFIKIEHMKPKDFTKDIRKMLRDSAMQVIIGEAKTLEEQFEEFIEVVEGVMKDFDADGQLAYTGWDADRKLLVAACDCNYTPQHALWERDDANCTIVAWLSPWDLSNVVLVDFISELYTYDRLGFYDKIIKPNKNYVDLILD